MSYSINGRPMMEPWEPIPMEFYPPPEVNDETYTVIKRGWIVLFCLFMSVLFVSSWAGGYLIALCTSASGTYKATPTSHTTTITVDW